MKSNLDKELSEQPEAEIIEDARKVYSEKVIEHWLNPRNWGSIENPQGVGMLSRVCGDGVEITLRINSDKITEAKFFTEGCGPMLAAGSMVTELAMGKNIREAFKISPEMILDELGGLPEESEHCAVLASETLKEALKDYLVFKREPWKRAYQKH